MKEKNREELLEELEKKKRELESQRELHAQLSNYNQKRASKLLSAIAKTRGEVEHLQRAIIQTEDFEEKPSPQRTIISNPIPKQVALIHQTLKEASHALAKKFFLPLFFHHPKVHCAKLIYAGAVEARSLKKSLDQKKWSEEELITIEAIRTLCNQLIDECEKKWNPHLYKGGLSELCNEWEGAEALASALNTDP